MSDEKMLPLMPDEKIVHLARYQELAGSTAIYPCRNNALLAADHINRHGFPAPWLVTAEPGNINSDAAFAYIGLNYPFIGLSNEAGETAGKIKKICRDNNGVLTPETREALAKELGDAFWYLSECATVLGYSLSEIATMNARKLFKRQLEGTLKGSGDNR